MKQKIAIIGESCIDEYIYGTCDRVCPEAAALCFRNEGKVSSNPGMAANVYENLKALNKDNEFQIDLISSKSSIIKRRFVDKKYNTIIFREDINDTCLAIDINKTDFSIYDCIIFSDYCKGFLSEQDIENIVNLKNKTCTTFLDTKKPLNKKITQIIDFIKINNKEFKENISSIDHIDGKCYLIVTQGENGAVLYHNKIQKFFPTNKIILRDVCGAGDTFLAGLAISYLKDRDVNEAIRFANDCATKVVTKFGVVTA